MADAQSDQNEQIINGDVRPRRSHVRCQRPTALLTSRNRSESPATRSKSRPSDVGLSPSGDDSTSYDLQLLQGELERKSGVLKFGSETLCARMDDFINEGLLGSGTCSSVYKMRHSRSDLVMAVKYMRRSSTCQEENKRIMMDLNVVTRSNDCAFIVECFGIFFTSGDVWICMEVMSTCLDKLLRDLHRPFPERVIGKITVSITTALDYLKRKHNMMHRDVKPSNMLLSYEGVVKLCDFGISGKLKDSIARSRQLGCIGYMAPERLETPTYDVRADIWSLGISLLELATGSFPYKGTEIEFAIMSKIISDPPPSLPHHIPFTPAFRFFIDCCLKKDHRQRPKYRSLMNIEFFCRHNVAPYDVLDWLRGLPLKHLHRQSDFQLSSKSFPISPVALNGNTSVNSPNSSSTLSPDAAIALHDASLEDSFGFRNAENAPDTHESATLDVVLVAAPSVDPVNNGDEYRNPWCPTDVTHNLPSWEKAVEDNSDAVNCAKLIDLSISANDVATSIDTAFVNDRPVPEQVEITSLHSNEPPSLASSGYGSGGSDGSPGSFAISSRPPNGKSLRDLNRLGPFVGDTRLLTAAPHSVSSDNVKVDHFRVKPVQLESQDLNGIARETKQDQWSMSSSSSYYSLRTTKPITLSVRSNAPNSMSPDLKGTISPLLNRFKPQVHSNGNARFHIPTTCVPTLAIDRMHRSFTPPLNNCLPGISVPTKANLDRPSRTAKLTAPQSRSSSVGAHLQRTPAQRWNTKPSFGDGLPANACAQKGKFTTRSPTVSDQRHTGQYPRSYNKQAEHNVPSFFEQSRHECHHSFNPPPLCCSSLRRMVGSSQLKTSDPGREPHLQSYNSSYSCNSTRLAHRLPTHPLPGQSGSTGLLGNGTSDRLTSHISLQHHFPQMNRLSPLPAPSRNNEKEPRPPPRPVRTTSRSLSQPASSKSHNLQSFETAL